MRAIVYVYNVYGDGALDVPYVVAEYTYPHTGPAVTVARFASATDAVAFAHRRDGRTVVMPGMRAELAAGR